MSHQTPKPRTNNTPLPRFARRSASLPQSRARVLVKVEARSFEHGGDAQPVGRAGFGKAPKPVVGTVLAAERTSQVRPGERVITHANPRARQLRVPAASVVSVASQYDPLVIASWLGPPCAALHALLQQTQLHQDDWILLGTPLSPFGTWVLRFSRLLRVRTINLATNEDEAVAVLDCHGDVIARYRDGFPQRLQQLVARYLPRLALFPSDAQLPQEIADCLPPLCHLVGTGRLRGATPTSLRAPLLNTALLQSALTNQYQLPLPKNWSPTFLDAILALASAGALPNMPVRTDCDTPCTANRVSARTRVDQSLRAPSARSQGPPPLT